MNKDYIKLPVDIVHDPVYGTLTDDLWKLMIQLNLVAGLMDKDGLLPAVRDMAWLLRMGAGTLQISLHQLSERGLLQSTPQGWWVTGFKESQAPQSSAQRSRAFRKRQRAETLEEQDSNEIGRRSTTLTETELQLSRPYPVSNPVAEPPKKAGKNRRRHKTSRQAVDTCPQDKVPVDKPVDNFVEKGRKNSDPMQPTSSTSSLINSLKTSLNNTSTTTSTSGLISKKPELEQPELEIFRSSQGKNPKDPDSAPGKAAFDPPGASGSPAGQKGTMPENFRLPGETHPGNSSPVHTFPVDKTVDKAVDNSVEKDVEKGRKNSDPNDNPT